MWSDDAVPKASTIEFRELLRQQYGAFSDYANLFYAALGPPFREERTDMWPDSGDTLVPLSGVSDDAAIGNVVHVDDSYVHFRRLCPVQFVLIKGSAENLTTYAYGTEFVPATSVSSIHMMRHLRDIDVRYKDIAKVIPFPDWDDE